MKHSLPWADVRVALVGAHDLPGLLLARLLREQGAAVTSVDVAGDGARDQLPASARAVLAASDIAVLGRQPGGAAADVGALREAVQDVKPDIITCSLPAFPTGGPGSEGEAAPGDPPGDGLVAAAAGIFAGPGDDPVYTRLAIPSAFAALGAAVGVATAMLWRLRTGEGQHVEASRFAGAYFALGASGLMVGEGLSGGRPDDPWSGPMRCGDGGWVWLNLPTRKFVCRFVEAVGLAPDLVAMTSWSGNGNSPELRAGQERRRALDKQLAELFLSRDSRAWEEFGRRIDVPLTRVREAGEAGTERDVTADIRELGSGEAPASPPGAAPVGPPRRIWPLASRLPLAGIRVADFTQVLAGPVAGRVLGDLGADVLKVNNPAEDGAGYKWNPLRYHADVNRGKKSVLWDLKSPGGAEYAARTLRHADIVIHNFRRGAAAELGLSPADLARKAPGAVQVLISAFAYDGPAGDTPGYEPNAQAWSGMTAGSQAAGGRARLQPLAVNDYGTGLLAAFGSLVALCGVARGKVPAAVHVSLADTARFLVTAALDGDRAGDTLGAVPATRAPSTAPDGIYQARDGWLYAGAAAKEVASALGGRGDPGSLRDLCRELPAGELLARLRASGIAACEVRSRNAVMRDPWALETGAAIEWDYAGLSLTTVGFPVRLSGSPARPRAWCSEPGHDDKEVREAWGLAQ